MKNIKVYGNDNCPTCLALKKDLNSKNMEFEYLDILGSLTNLKQYLFYRDNHPGFEQYKKNQKFGIPLVIVDDDGEIDVLIEIDSASFI